MANTPPPSDDLQHQEIVEAYQRQGRWILPTLLVLVFGVAVGAIYAKPAYRWLRERRGEALAREAEIALASGDLETAVLRMRTAVRIAPKSVRVARITAEICDLYGVPEALGFWQTVIANPAADDRDRQRFVSSALRSGRDDLAQPELGKLLLKDERDIENLRLSIQYLRQRGELDPAIFTARRVVELHPTNPAPKLALATLLVGHPMDSLRREGRERLWSLATNPGPAQVEALLTLAQERTLSPTDKSRLADLLEPMPTTWVEPRLRMMSLRIELDPASRPRWVAEVAAQVAKETNRIEVTRKLSWLHDQKAAEALLAAMPLDRARRDPGWVFWHLSSLGAVGRWDEMKTLLEDNSLPLAQYRRYGLLATVAHAKGNLDMARNHLDSAVGAAHGQFEEQQRLARMAEEMGDFEMAMRGWSEILEIPSLARPAAQQILRLSQRGDRSDLVVLATRRLLSLSRDDTLALNELAYTLLLEGRRDPEVESQLKTAASTPDAQPGLRITLALLALQENRVTDALDQLEGHGLDLEKGPSRWRFIHAVVLAANQQRESAKRILATVDTSRLKAAEKNLLSKWF